MPNTRPPFTTDEIAQIIQAHYNISGSIKLLPSYRDQNFHLTTLTGKQIILKITNLAESVAILDMQNKAMALVSAHYQGMCPHTLTAVSGQLIETATAADGTAYPMRLLTYLPGTLYAHISPQDAHLQHSLGQCLGRLDSVLTAFVHPAAHRYFKWNLVEAAFINDYTQYIQHKNGRALVRHFLTEFETNTLPQLSQLRHQIIHNDANDYNVLVNTPPTKSSTNQSGLKEAQNVTSIIDFGDMVYAPTVCEAAIGAAYALLGQPDPIFAAAQVISGYHEAHPLLDDEIALLFNLIAMRLCVSVTMSSYNLTQEPDNPYLQISAKPAWEALEKLTNTDAAFAHAAFRHACKLPSIPHPPSPVPSQGTTHWPQTKLLVKRQQHVAPSFSLSYDSPLKIVRGYKQYLYDENGRAYLDAVNNVPHVGHCHPHVVRAGQRQMALLNTNTRYLHDYLAAYAERLAAKFPDPLNVVYFVCSGSEANELALRLARTATSRHDILVLDGAYHGNTGELVNLSPYKFNGPGGKGAPPYVHVLPMPDPYRGNYKGYGRETGHRYAQYVQETLTHLQAQGTPAAAFIAEPLLGCGGQIVMPDGYLAKAYEFAKAAGTVCIADEVQIGFGRVGTHFWGFETQNALPDIVTMGKPIGNGHPLAAVITTPEIAHAFANGMEYFNTFGGNPVSCAIGLAVLDVIEQENLQDNALKVGNHLLAGLRRLQAKYPLIGDVRGRGLYIGAELVRDRQTLEPAAAEAAAIVNAMKNQGILISTDGPLHNVLKIKPPLVFTKENADQLIDTLDNILATYGGSAAIG